MSEFADKGIRIPGTHPTIVGEFSFEPPVTLNSCFLVGPCFLGRFSYIGNFTHIEQNTRIGRFCGIASNCAVGASAHPLDWLSTHPFQYCAPQEPIVETKSWPVQQTIIGHDVLIGANAVVMAGVKVGSGAVIGAGSIVTKDVPPYAIVVGNPARFLRFRFSEDIVSELLALEWWNLPEAEIAQLPFQDIRACITHLRGKGSVTV